MEGTTRKHPNCLAEASPKAMNFPDFRPLLPAPTPWGGSNSRRLQTGRLGWRSRRRPALSRERLVGSNPCQEVRLLQLVKGWVVHVKKGSVKGWLVGKNRDYDCTFVQLRGRCPRGRQAWCQWRSFTRLPRTRSLQLAKLGSLPSPQWRLSSLQHRL